MMNKKSIITAHGDINFSNIKNSQIAIGDNITQNLSISEMEELVNNLIKFQENMAQLKISRTDIDIINDDLKAAINESEKEKPSISKIKDKFENIIDIIKKTDGAMSIVSKWLSTKAIVSLLGKAGLFIAGMT